jgi:radical SAM superfamily enzyme YgiQ (UPF0313 family)
MSRVLIVDLNNFARYPTLAIAYLVTPLRAAGFTVDVLSPLNIGAPPATHEKAENWQEHLLRRVNHATHPVMQSLHEHLRKAHERWQARPHKPTLSAVEQQLKETRPDIILLSAYLNHYPAVRAIAARAKAMNIPVLLGGPAFTSQQTIDEWIDLKGVSAIFAGEADTVICDLVADTIAGTAPAARAGLFVRTADNKATGTVAAPLQDLDTLPVPDFSDFPWQAYPHRIIPILTGRGCGWGVCTFCSDVITANGRGFRSRSLDNVLTEMRHQIERYDSKDFIFLDLKLNSDLAVWYRLIENFQRIAPGGRWIATVHVDGKGENGLDYETLKRAADSGLTRISFGMETASPSLIKRMAKGTRVERNQQFIEDAWRAGLSVRCSMMLGYPGETEDDLVLTRDFLDHNRQHFDRIRPARFKAIPGTPFETHFNKPSTRVPGVATIQWDHRYARAAYRYTTAAETGYRQVKREILQIIHQINREPLRDGAVQFDGLM